MCLKRKGAAASSSEVGVGAIYGALDLQQSDSSRISAV